MKRRARRVKEAQRVPRSFVGRRSTRDAIATAINPLTATARPATVATRRPCAIAGRIQSSIRTYARPSRTAMAAAYEYRRPASTRIRSKTTFQTLNARTSQSPAATRGERRTLRNRLLSGNGCRWRSSEACQAHAEAAEQPLVVCRAGVRRRQQLVAQEDRIGAGKKAQCLCFVAERESASGKPNE